MKFTSYNVFMRDLYRGGIEYAALHSASLGFSGVEFLDFCEHGHKLDKEKLKGAEARRIVEANGLTVDCFSAFANLMSDDREGTLASLYGMIDYAAELGSPAFHHTLVPMTRGSEEIPTYDEIFEDILKIEQAVAKYCADRSMKCLYEPQGRYFNGVQGLSRLIHALNETCDNVGLCADLGNSVFVDEDPVSVMEALWKYAVHAHIKNYRLSDESLGLPGELRSVGGKYIYEVFPPEGDIRLGEGIKILRESGYKGSFSLEFATDDDRMREIMKDLNSLDV